MVSKNEWSLLIVEDAQKDFDSLAPRVQKLVYRKLQRIQKNPLRIGRALKLKETVAGIEKNRIIFTVSEEEEEIYIWAIGQRDQTQTHNSLLRRVNKFFTKM